MLVMSRREGETILIGDDIEIQIVQLGRSRVRVGIRAPRETPVVAREVKLVRDQNREAAAAPSQATIDSLLEKFRPRSSRPSGSCR